MKVIENDLPNYQVDPNRPIPFHTQVKEALESQIKNGTWQVGDQLPGEQKLCKLFGVSRTVIRHALDQLMRDGLVTRVMGKGTFIAEPKIHEGLVGSLTGFFEDMERQGFSPYSKILKQERAPAGAKVARNLEVELGTTVIEIQRLRYVKDVPLVLVTTYLPDPICSSLLNVDLTNQSLYAYLENNCNLTIARGKRTIEAVPANPQEAKLLEIPVGSPLILLDSVSYLDDGTPVEYYHAVHRSDRARFEVNLIRVHNE